MSDNSEPASESPLSAIEKETEEFKKEVKKAYFNHVIRKNCTVSF